MLEPIKTKKIYTLIMQQIQELLEEKQLKPVSSSFRTELAML
jgi:hypothetical protein